MLVEFYKVLFLVSVALGCFIILGLLKVKKRAEAKAMAVFIAAVLVFPTHAYLQLILDYIPLFISKATHSFILLYGPFAYCFLSFLLKKRQFQAGMLWHFLPFVLVLSIFLLQLDRAKWLMAGLSFAQVVFYLVINSSLMLKHKAQLKTIYKYYRNSRYFWLLLIVIGSSLLAIYDMLLICAWIVNQGLANSYWHLWVATNSVFLLLIAWFYLYRSDFFAPAQQGESLSEDDPGHHKKLRQCIELSDTMIAPLRQKLDLLVMQQRPHLNNELSLAELAASLGVSTNQLSELLNCHLNKSFYTWLNELRYQEACLLLKSADHEHLSILDIAYLSGFNNKNTFYRVFKQYADVTPSQYRSLH